MAGGLRAETRPPGQEEGSGRDRPTRGLWDSLSLVVNRSKRDAKRIFGIPFFIHFSPQIFLYKKIITNSAGCYFKKKLITRKMCEGSYGMLNCVEKLIKKV